jgi:hypothetical protein
LLISLETTAGKSVTWKIGIPNGGEEDIREGRGWGKLRQRPKSLLG